MSVISRSVAVFVSALFVGHLGAASARAEGRDLKVRLTLVSGGRLEGVVRDGALYERLVEGQFVRTSSPEVPGAGMRLWRVEGTSGFFFVKYSDIRELKEIGPADAAEEAAADAALREKKLAGKPAQPGESKQKAGAKPATKGQLPPVSPEAAALLKKFPPEAGWTPEKKTQIERRRTVIGAFPSPNEKEWLDNYSKWLPAYEHWLSENPDKAPKTAPPSTTPDKPSDRKTTDAGSGGADDKTGKPAAGVDGRPEKERPHKTTKREEREAEKKAGNQSDSKDGAKDGGESDSSDDAGNGG